MFQCLEILPIQVGGKMSGTMEKCQSCLALLLTLPVLLEQYGRRLYAESCRSLFADLVLFDELPWLLREIDVAD